MPREDQAFCAGHCDRNKGIMRRVWTALRETWCSGECRGGRGGGAAELGVTPATGGVWAGWSPAPEVLFDSSLL